MGVNFYQVLLYLFIYKFFFTCLIVGFVIWFWNEELSLISWYTDDLVMVYNSISTWLNIVG